MRFYLGILAAAVAIFLWGFVMWELLAVRVGMLKPLPNEEPVVRALVDTDVPTGVYIYPLADAATAKLSGEAKDAAFKLLDDKAKKGPLVRVFVDREGKPYMDPKVLQLGFLHMLLAAAILATLTRSVLSWADFKARYAFVVAVGVFAAVWIDFSNAIWMAAPWDHQLFVAGYDVGAWILAGVPIAWGTRSDILTARG
jgi:hypothetical protein